MPYFNGTEGSEGMQSFAVFRSTHISDTTEQLYVSLGWNKVGIIPNYALYPDGRLGATTVFYKQLRRTGEKCNPVSRSRFR